VPEKLHKISNPAGRLSYKWQPFTHIVRCLRKKETSACPIQKKLIFTVNHATMQLLKLTVLSSLLFALAISFTSCEPETEIRKTLEYSKTAIPMTGAQEAAPFNVSPAIGSLDVYYNKTTKILTYKFTWQGLTDTITGIHIHGLAPVGYNAGIVQNILINGTKNEALFPFRGGTFTGTFNVDGVVVKEENLLNGFYYLNIHTQGIVPGLAPPNNRYTGGEIRGQIKFQ
jgi:hypothetical protein